MSAGGDLSERALIFAPRGRDAQIADAILTDGGVATMTCPSLAKVVAEMERGAGLAVIADEGLSDVDVGPLVQWIGAQPSWSDFPFVLLTQRGGSVERNPALQRASGMLGNVAFLERPFHPSTLVSAAQTALRGRRRQYEARERIDEIRRGEALLERRVTERTAELEAANRMLAGQIAERERAETALAQAQRLEAVGQLTSGIAHDFNNLLTVVIGNVEQMKKHETDERTRRRLSMMEEASRRGARLTAQMLAFSRRQKLEPRSVDLNDTVRSMGDLLQSSIGGSVDIQPPDLAPDLWPAMIDPTQIELVILNLAINARDAMEVGGRLTITTRNVEISAADATDELPTGQFVEVSVADNGSGMTDEVLARAFEPFFTTKAVGKGSGLGLSQVFGLARQSGGGVRIRTAVGAGTTISVYLPRADHAPHHQGADSRMDFHPGAQATILVVDDDDAVREITTGYLSDLGYNVVEAGSGGAAVERFRDNDAVAAVLLDFAMPGMNGNEVARELRKIRTGVPIIFVTGYADADALAEADPGCIVPKPFARVDLTQALERALRHPSLPVAAARIDSCRETSRIHAPRAV
ncbi:response regulator [Brevundimonas sp. PAMC22021]|uniref:response regulator n=1 Tax=Brevundimonas sp. PAMC22021 TaxID=2861285 RepID=UPI001C63070C|nr:response regulator [Brevundimonas sp. PAMC22021]QYF88148.1 response regulator [Brevundimonas sp. PAMC22021]